MAGFQITRQELYNPKVDLLQFCSKICNPDCPVLTPNRASGANWEKMAKKWTLAHREKMAEKWENGHFSHFWPTFPFFAHFSPFFPVGSKSMFRPFFPVCARSPIWGLQGSAACNVHFFVPCSLGLRVVSPLEGPGSLRGGNPRKMRKITKFPSPLRPLKMGEIAPRKGRNYSENNFSPILGVGPGRGVL